MAKLFEISNKEIRESNDVSEAIEKLVKVGEAGKFIKIINKEVLESKDVFEAVEKLVKIGESGKLEAIDENGNIHKLKNGGSEIPRVEVSKIVTDNGTTNTIKIIYPRE